MRTHAHIHTRKGERNSSSGRSFTRDLRHHRLSTAFSWLVSCVLSFSLFLSSISFCFSLSLSYKRNTVARRDSFAAHRPIYSEERTCLPSHDNNDGDNWPSFLRTPRVNRRKREKRLSSYILLREKVNEKYYNSLIYFLK